MSHLSPERLAALADAGEIAHPHEVEHLAACGACARERDACRAVVEAAHAERHAVGAPLTRWEGIAAGLRGAPDRIVVAARPAGRPDIGPRPVDVAARRRIFTVATRAAAAVLLLAGGATVGRLSAVTGPLAVSPAVDGGAGRFATTRPEEALGAGRFETIAEAQSALTRHEEGYQRAAAFLAENDTTAWLAAPDGYRTRLVALESAGRTIREAMEEAPYDPVLTGYYLTTLGQREATLRQLNVAVPAGARLNTF
jgi:hypothetical protein